MSRCDPNQQTPTNRKFKGLLAAADTVAGMNAALANDKASTIMRGCLKRVMV